MQISVTMPRIFSLLLSKSLIANAMHSAMVSISATVRPRVVMAAVPRRRPLVDVYKRQVKDDVMSSQDIEYSHVDFLFKGNADTPLRCV